MVKRALKVAGIGVGALIGLLFVSVGVAYGVSVSKEDATYAVRDDTFEIPSAPEAIAEGERLYVSRGCGDCHGADGGGRTIMDDVPARVTGTNLTRATDGYSARDWSRAVRYGLNAEGRALVFMPSHEYYGMSDRDLAMIAAYVARMPDVDRELPETEVRVVGRFIELAGGLALFPASQIDHAAERPQAPEPAPTVEYGAYLGIGCTGCHGAQLSGGAVPGAPPELGMPLNLTPHETGLGTWSRDDFVRAMREGVAPDGRHLDAEQMPWRNFGRMNDVELHALWAWLQTLPPVPEGNR